LLSDQETVSDEEDEDGVEAEQNLVDMSELSENMVLYRASAVHNLPVMCLAIARGADKNWCNEKDLDRTPLHQTVLSVSVNFEFFKTLQSTTPSTHTGFNYGLRIFIVERQSH
jgi:hypothetical protein